MPRNARQRAGGLLKPKEGLNGPPPNTDRRAAPDNAYALIEGQPLTGTMGDIDLFNSVVPAAAVVSPRRVAQLQPSFGLSGEFAGRKLARCLGD